MTLSRDSLGGKNGGRIPASACSSHAPSAIFNRLRELDRDIAKLDDVIRIRSYGRMYFKNNVLIQNYTLISNLHYGKTELVKIIDRRIKLDLKRKEVRNKRKYWGRIKGLKGTIIVEELENKNSL